MEARRVIGRYSGFDIIIQGELLNEQALGGYVAVVFDLLLVRIP